MPVCGVRSISLRYVIKTSRWAILSQMGPQGKTSRWAISSHMGPRGKNKQVDYIVSDGPSG